MPNSKILTRDLLAQVFDNNHKMIKAFEQLYQTTYIDSPELIEEIQIFTQSAIVQGNNLHAVLLRVVDYLEKLDVVPKHVPITRLALDILELNINASVYAKEGSFTWNAQDRCPEYVTGLGNSTQIGQELWGNGVNKTGGTVNDGEVVYASGVQGIRLTYDYADARDPVKCGFVGVITASTADNAEGPVTTFGLVRDFDTTAWSNGDKLYIAADGTGVLTNTAPSAPDFRVWVATVVLSHPTQGVIFVNPKLDYTDGVTLNSLHVRTVFTSGDIANGNYVEFETTGFRESHGAARDWDDVYPSAVTVGFGANAPSFTTYSGNMMAYEFVGTSLTKQIFAEFQIYHSYDEGTDVTPHIHLYIPNDATGGNIRFYAEYHWDNVGDTGAVAVATVNGNVTRAASAGISKNHILSFGSISGVGKKISSIMSMRIYRDSTDPADTFTSSVWLRSADIHIHKNTDGSRQEFIK